MYKMLRAFPQAKIFVWYSVTEIGIISGIFLEDVVPNQYTDCGLLFPAVSVKLLDLKTGRPVGHNTLGEIFATGPAQMMGLEPFKKLLDFFESITL